MKLAEMSMRINSDQFELYKKLRDEIKNVPCFRYNGVLFEGDYAEAAISFVYNNPNGGDFYVWLQDNYKFAL